MKIEKIGENRIEVRRNKKRGVKLVIEEDDLSLCNECVLFTKNNNLCIPLDGFNMLCSRVKDMNLFKGDFHFIFNSNED